MIGTNDLHADPICEMHSHLTWVSKCIRKRVSIICQEDSEPKSNKVGRQQCVSYFIDKEAHYWLHDRNK